MDNFLVVRIAKPVVMALVAYFSIHYLTGSVFDAAVVALLPLVLGWVGVLTALGYSASALSVVVAVVWAIMPTTERTLVRDQFASLQQSIANGSDAQKRGADAANHP